MPKVISLPQLTDSLLPNTPFDKSRQNSPKKINMNNNTKTSTMDKILNKNVHHNGTNHSAQIQSNENNSLITSKLDRLDKFNPINNKLIKPSSENWIPDNIRLKSRMREIAIAKKNLDEMMVREMDQAREQKRISIPLYDKALNEESLSMIKKIPCGCCLQKYLTVNLPLKVSKKAIIDVRVKWTGEMYGV